MPILFIGKTNLRNDSIKELIRARDGNDVNHIDPQQLTAFVNKNSGNKNRYQTIIIDLHSFALPPLKVISLIRDSVKIKRLIVINGPGQESKLEPIIKNRTNYYLPHNFEIEELFKALEKQLQ
ncbi:hypothetical protein [Aliifodinibius sp. S!AR15-10]|uniref:hypothetical protein n=1 Tax=Aliifodinibius sp. S!AR15-10 TaxID=2950437 RepID=UPI002870ADE3|nr:hypothetical protein [Aliifodinibius sp. S!AR15-10]